MTTDIPIDELRREAASLKRRMSLTRAARMCGVSPGTVSAWADGRELSPAMMRAVAIASACSAAGWVGVFGTIRPPMGVRVVAEMDSSGDSVRVTMTTTDERGRL